MWHEASTVSQDTTGRVRINLSVEWFPTLTPPPYSELRNFTVVMHVWALVCTEKMKALLVVAL